MKKTTINACLLMAIVFGLFTACNKDDDLLPGSGSNGEFSTLYNGVGNMPVPIENEESDILDQESVVMGNTEFNCTSEHKSISAASGGTDGFPLFAPNNAVIYPGAMLQGKSLSSGNPDLIALKRGSGTISTDIIDGNSQSSVDVDLINRGNVIDAMNTIVGEGSQVVPANFGLKIRNIQSREQFALELGVDVNSTYVDIESDLSYTYSETKSTFMVNLEQSYYTMSYDIPVSRETLFDPEVTAEQLQEYVYEGNPATYISDVTYGRIFYMLIESTSTKHDLKVAVESSFSKLKTEVQADVSVDYFNELEEITYSIFAYGGEAGGTLQAAGVSNMDDLVDILAETTDIRSAKPLSYVVRNVGNNQIVATQLATEYEVENCEISGVNGTLPMLEHWTGNVISAMGPVGAAFTQELGSDKFILINEDGDQYMRSTDGSLSGPHPIIDLWDADLPLNGIGAACMDYTWKNPDRLLAFDLSGANYAIFDNGNWGSKKSISDFARGTHPFNLTGVGAIAHASFDGDWGGDNHGGDNDWHFNGDGTKYVHKYSHKVEFNGGLPPDIEFVNFEEFTDVRELRKWGINDSVTNKISSVGAAIGFEFGDDHFTILFNKAGTKYIVYGNINGDEPREVVGPFDL